MFNIVNLEEFDRIEHYNRYLNINCRYSLTVQLDIDKLYHICKDEKLKFYPTLLWFVTKAVNKFQFMRYFIDKNTDFGYFDKMNVAYTLKPKDKENFGTVWTEYSDDFKEFYNNYLKDITYCEAGFEFKGNKPDNCYDFSNLLWLDFTSFDIKFTETVPYLPPIITTGKINAQTEKVSIPFNISVHHSVCDGYHLSLFFDYLNEILNDCHKYLF